MKKVKKKKFCGLYEKLTRTIKLKHMGALRQTIYFIWPYKRNFHMFLLLITHWKASKDMLICYNNYRSINLYKETFPYFQHFGVNVKVVHFLWHIYRKLSFMIVLYCWILNYLVLNVYFSGTVLRPIGDVTMTKCHQQLNEILSFFLPALHPGNQQSCLQENLSRNTLVELNTILYVQASYSIRLP